MTNSEQVSAKIKQLILDKKFSNNQLPTETELMVQFSVSRYAVRKATDDLQAQGLIRKVQGGGMYINATQPEHESTQTLVLLSPHPDEDSELIRLLEAAAADRGFTLLQSSCATTTTKQMEQLGTLDQLGVDGIILESNSSLSPSSGISNRPDSTRLKTPLLTLFSGFPISGHATIGINDEEAEFQATHAIIEAGHKQLLGIFAADEIRKVRRMNGFVRSYQQHPEIAANSYMETYRASEDQAGILARVTSLFTRLPVDLQPTAILTDSDQLAVTIMKLIQSLNRHVPRDIAVVGFGDTPLSRLTTPELSSISFDKSAFATYVIDQMLHQIAGQTPKSKTFKTTLVSRASSLKPTKSKRWL